MILAFSCEFSALDLRMEIADVCFKGAFAQHREQNLPRYGSFSSHGMYGLESGLYHTDGFTLNSEVQRRVGVLLEALQPRPRLVVITSPRW